MAAKTRNTTRRPYRTEESRGGSYVHGNTVRQPEYIPKREPQRKKEEREKQQRQKHRSRRVAKNRQRAMAIGKSYTVFLAAASVCAVFVCAMYLHLQSDVRAHSDKVAALQERLSDLTEANNTAYNAVVDSVNLEMVCEKAKNEMGMVYASQGKIIYYISPTSDYVKQYDEIPDSGILAQSKNPKE